MRILLVSSWGTACGIAEFGAQLVQAAHAADPTLTFLPCPEGLDPACLPAAETYDAVFLNFHLGLHSRWMPEHITALKRQGKPVVVDFHDTRGEQPPEARAQQLHDLADAFVVHEPCEGLPRQILIRQGIPAAASLRLWELDKGHWRQYPDQPVLGTAGFNFPWKLYDELAVTTAAAGWAFLLCANNATDADEKRWKQANPHTRVVRGFQPTEAIVSALAACDATAVMYRCANSGTSGAIRLCLAARKPLFVSPCRQWNDLKRAEAEEWGVSVLREVADCTALIPALTQCPIQRVDPAVVFAAAKDSWVNQGRRYAEIFRSL